jgi:CDGSH-type Zn-finger protein
MDKFNLYRQNYQTFEFNKYEILETDEEINITYYFNINGLQEFKPNIRIKKKDIFVEQNRDNKFRNLIFHIGMVELISYWKCACPFNVVIKCGYLTKEQCEWFKKLYYYGLGEFFYTNGIDISYNDFMNITCDYEEEGITYNSREEDYIGNIIPVGGGKDSVVSLEILKNTTRNYCFLLNPKKDSLECIEMSGYTNDKVIEVYRTIDPNLIKLNNEGYLNGHTPFSALLAFITYFMAYLTRTKYIALSNESSANESNVVGTKVNHQYSKSYEFENDFYNYTMKYLDKNIKYFSLLRPISELQIAMLFSHYEKYHHVFKSCNVGSKNQNWNWCCECAKCLFVYIVLSPFLYKERLVNIFHEDLFEKERYLNTFKELCGFSNNKPFDCVGTYEEVNYAIKTTIKSLDGQNIKLPYLLQYYKDNYFDTVVDENLLGKFNEENNVPEEYKNILEQEVLRCIQE